MRTRGAMAQTQLVHVEGGYAVTVFGGVVQHLAQASKSHRNIQKIDDKQGSRPRGYWVSSYLFSSAEQSAMMRSGAQAVIGWPML